MLPTVNAIRDLGLVGRGGSGAHFFSCDDNKEYVVKFVDNTKTAVNELVGSSLALKIRLPTPQIAFVKAGNGYFNYCIYTSKQVC